MHTYLNQIDRRLRLLIGGACLVVIAAGIRAARGILDSLLLALLLTIVVLPIYTWLRRRKLGNGAAIVLTTVFLIAVVLLLLGFLGISATQLISTLPTYQARVEGLRDSLEALLLARGIDPDQVLRGDALSPGRALGLAAGFLSGAGKVLSQTLLLLLIVAFILLEAGGATLDRFGQSEDRLGLVARDVRQYLVITTGTGAVFAVFCYILMLAVGTDLALVWGVLAFVMNFVPNVGIVLSLVPPLLLTLLEFGWQRAVVIVLGFVGMNFVIDNLMKPRFMQSGLDLSPLTGLLSLLAWSFLIGPLGALLAIPLTIAVRRLLEEAPAIVVHDES